MYSGSFFACFFIKKLVFSMVFMSVTIYIWRQMCYNMYSVEEDIL